ncbi:Uma2 family endonuclease [Cohnella sp. GbtcB17]|uniref:Uma2 family endonuclease n=1 Tax=Cohnella sp. GbtcB17 TaxID=2824762 RepID=UPI001C2F3F8C|nr:Uma2 family endonuclease [Cohnella sp. GbtcB17]
MEDKKRPDDKKRLEERVGEQQVTYDIYAAMPDDGLRYEVLDGSLELMSPGPNTSHQILSYNLQAKLSGSRKSEYLILYAPLDVILSPTNVVQPDLIFIRPERADIVTKRGIEGPPDLVVEILSPGSRHRDRVRKLRIYEKHGVPEYWIVDPGARTLEQHLLQGDRLELSRVYEGEDAVTSDRLPCVSFTVAGLFDDPTLQRLLSSN